MNMSKETDLQDDEEFQASSEDIDIKPWDLPYWRGGPKESQVVKQEEVEEEEVDVVEPLTVEELEAIRNEGYEEGFLQGLNEGREKGEKEGKEQGLIEGRETGNKEGKQEGNRIGFEAGEAEGLASGKDEINQAAENLSKLTQQLEQSLVDKDSALPQVISQLIRTACETIIERELEQGDNQITQKVISALDQLPGGAENIKIFVSPGDALHLEHGLSNSGREMHFDIDEGLSVGSARITTTQSLLEFSHRDRMEKVFELIDQQCEKLDLSDIAGETLVEEIAVEEVEVEKVAIEESTDEEALVEEFAEPREDIQIEQSEPVETEAQQREEVEVEEKEQDPTVDVSHDDSVIESRDQDDLP